MVATVATDAEGNGVEYQFARVVGPTLPTGDGQDGQWWNNVNVVGIIDPDGSARAPNELWVEVGSQFLDYSYRVRTRDQSPLQNTGNWSITVVADQ